MKAFILMVILLFLIGIGVAIKYSSKEGYDYKDSPYGADFLGEDALPAGGEF